MANWCSTNITIYHEDKSKIKNLYDLMDSWTSRENYIQNGFGLNWLGNIVGNSGIGTIDTDIKTDIRCRGEIVEMDYDGEHEIRIVTETAWSPMMTIWVELLEKYLPDAELIYEAVEPGCGIFYTNNYDLVDKYNLDIDYKDHHEYEYDYTEEDVVDILNDILGANETDIKILFKKLNQLDIDDGYICINQWEYLDPVDCE